MGGSRDLALLDSTLGDTAPPPPQPSGLAADSEAGAEVGAQAHRPGHRVSLSFVSGTPWPLVGLSEPVGRTGLEHSRSRFGLSW